MSACSETKSHLSKTRKSLFFSLPILSLYILIVVELWLKSRTSRGKKMNSVDTVSSRERNQHPSHVMNMNQCIILYRKTRERKQRILPPNLIYNWLIVYLSCLFFSRKKHFLFWVLLWLFLLFIAKRILSVKMAFGISSFFSTNIVYMVRMMIIVLMHPYSYTREQL